VDGILIETPFDHCAVKLPLLGQDYYARGCCFVNQFILGVESADLAERRGSVQDLQGLVFKHRRMCKLWFYATFIKTSMDGRWNDGRRREGLKV